MKDCIFCKIIRGEVPNHTIYEDEDFLAFLDIYPHAQGHTVIIPKTHVSSFLDFEEEKSKELFLVVKKVMRLLKEKLNPAGFNVGWNDGKEAGQVIPHLHLHIFPRYSGDKGGSMHSIIKNPGKLSVEQVAQLFN